MEEQIVECAKKCQPKNKRDIFKVNGSNPTALNFDHVTMITLQDKRITFAFGSNGLNVDMESSEVAANVYEELLKTWAGDVVA